MNRKALRSALILFMIGTFVTARQVSSDTVFHGDEDLDLEALALSTPVFNGGVENASYHCTPDTMETIEIELEKGTKTNIYKEIAMVAIVSAFAFYIIKTVFFGGEDETKTDTGGGKPFPTSTVSITFSP